MPYRTEKVASLLRHKAAQYLAEASDNTSLITVTDVQLSPDLEYATIAITVFPDEKQEDAIAFARRKRGELREYLKKHTELRSIPRLSIEIDHGEKRRQRIDELSRDMNTDTEPDEPQT